MKLKQNMKPKRNTKFKPRSNVRKAWIPIGVSAVCLAIVGISIASAQTPDTTTIPPTPSTIGATATTFPIVNTGHLEDTQWNLQNKTAGYSDITVTMTPVVNTFPSDQSYFYSLSAFFNKYTGTDQGVTYAGLQTNGLTNGKYIGKMAIFSVWDAVKATAPAGGTAVTFSNEGTGWSVHVPYNWQAHTNYRVKIYKNGTSGTNTIWSAQINNLTTKAVQQLGKIYVPTSYGNIYGPVTFHERYRGQPMPCNQVAPSEIGFQNMTANAGTAKATSWTEYYRQLSSACGASFWTSNTTTGYFNSVGPPS